MCRGSHSGNRRACSGYCWWSSSSTLPGWPQRPVSTNHVQTYRMDSLFYLFSQSSLFSSCQCIRCGHLCRGEVLIGYSVGWCQLKAWERGELVRSVLLYTTACLWLNSAALLRFCSIPFLFSLWKSRLSLGVLQKPRAWLSNGGKENFPFSMKER